MLQVVVVVGAGSIGQAIARRESVGKTVLLADFRPDNAEAAAKDEITNIAALLMGADGAFITGSDFLADGGSTAVHWFGEAALA